jgi:signal transduction histidine kinase
MARFRDLSFRYKIPLRSSALVLLTAVFVTTTLIAREYENSRADLLEHAGSIARVLSKTLVTPLLHDDVWRAFEIINAPFQAAPNKGATSAEIVLVLDPRQQVFVSTQPMQYPMLSDPARIDADYAPLQQAILAFAGTEPGPIELSKSDRIFMVAPIVSDGVSLGTLVMGYRTSIFVPRLVGIATRAGLVTLAVLAVLLPASWYWAQRTAVPLVELARGMSQVGSRPASEIKQVFAYESRDEIGQAGHAFLRMLGELREKEALEKEMIVSERLAAVGRLTAGIAHEINNPLGGLLNALSTFKKHGGGDPLTARTVALLECGLLQIKDTVAALLVEARVESHPLTRRDIEDTHTLALASVERKDLEFRWDNDIIDTLPLPSTLVRQVLINLQLNAIQATRDSGGVACHVYRDHDNLFVQISNGGRHITPEQMDYLFEPFTHFRAGGTGLGLWMTYQIVRQMQGEITVDSKPGETCFVVRLPLKGMD